jgi:integrase
VGAARTGRGAARFRVWADGRVRRGDRASPLELFALEQRDLDLDAGVVFVRRAFANGRVKQTKTRLSTRAVPLQALALDAVDRLPISEGPLLFTNSRGGYIDFRNFGARHWKPAQIAAGIEPLRYLYDLRHIYATSRFAPASRYSRSPASWARAWR